MHAWMKMMPFTNRYELTSDVTQYDLQYQLCISMYCTWRHIVPLYQMCVYSTATTVHRQPRTFVLFSKYSKYFVAFLQLHLAYVCVCMRCISIDRIDNSSNLVLNTVNRQKLCREHEKGNSKHFIWRLCGENGKYICLLSIYIDNMGNDWSTCETRRDAAFCTLDKCYTCVLLFYSDRWSEAWKKKSIHTHIHKHINTHTHKCNFSTSYIDEVDIDSWAMPSAFHVLTLICGSRKISRIRAFT